jgi:hypothetical protein
MQEGGPGNWQQGDAGHPAGVGRLTERVNGTTKEEFDCENELGKIDQGPTANVA